MAWSLQFISGIVLTRLGWPPGEQVAVMLISGAKSWWMQIYLGVFAVVLAPVAEEFIFRGLLYPFFKQLGYPRLALFGVSLAFAAIHFDAATFVPLFVLALALTWLYELTDSLWRRSRRMRFLMRRISRCCILKGHCTSCCRSLDASII